jgi:cellulose synthase/poly-beta-1,6-N-acetylglucosamine synthase-like glycosyltransferase
MSSLNVCIPSIIERRDKLAALIQRIEQLAEGYDVKILFAVDNKEMSIGAKRQALLNACAADYMVMLDDDDNLHDEYFEHVMPLLEKNPDCVGYYELVVGKTVQEVKHSITCKQWTDSPLQRTPFYKTPIRTELAKAVTEKTIHSLRLYTHC